MRYTRIARSSWRSTARQRIPCIEDLCSLLGPVQAALKTTVASFHDHGHHLYQSVRDPLKAPSGRLSQRSSVSDSILLRLLPQFDGRFPQDKTPGGA